MPISSANTCGSTAARLVEKGSSQRARVFGIPAPGGAGLLRYGQAPLLEAASVPGEKRELVFGKSQHAQVVAAIRLAQFLSYVAAMGSDPLGGWLVKEKKL